MAKSEFSVKHEKGGERMNKKNGKTSVACSLFLIVILLFGTQSVASVFAKKPTVIYVENATFGDYTYTYGKLGKAEYGLFMPEDNWNGMLVVFCRGHMSEMPHIPHDPSDPRLMMGRNFMTIALMNPLADGKRFAYAWSNYGEGGYCLKAGVLRTHQLTEYIIDQYDVSGKVFLMSMSMGGAVSLILAEKYPNLYSGVVDCTGVKSLSASYLHKATIASKTGIDDLLAYFMGYPANIAEEYLPEYEDEAECLEYIAGAGETAEEMIEECGGTPDEKPQFYARKSPLDNPEISVPVITVHGTADTQVPFSQSEEYRDAVNAVTEPDLCRLYAVEGAGHTSMAVYSQAIPRLFELVMWSDMLDPP
jgi:pimeloyl-ACP methyl ester carboxylesterase